MSASPRPLLPSTETSLRRQVDQAQRDWRAPSVCAAVIRDGHRLLDHVAGWGGPDAPASGAPTSDIAAGDVQYRIGSITKTFTAVLILALRDEGRLTLDDPLGLHVPGGKHGGLTIRQLLTHLSGIQREPVGDVWWTLRTPDHPDFLAGLELAEAVLPPQRQLHYSNVAYAILGEVVARLDGRSWAESLGQRILRPLGLSRTTLDPATPHARGWFVDPYADRLLAEPDFPTRALAPAMQLWSTATDLTRWAAFIADPVAEVLAPATVDEMCHPQVMWDIDAWNLAWGLGFMLLRQGDRILVGHEGAMPGFLAGCYTRRSDSVGAVAFANCTSGADPGGLAAGLITTLLEAEPTPVRPWRPGAEVDPNARPLLGRWWSEGSEFVFGWTDGALTASIAGAPHRPPAVFVAAGPDEWRVASGREVGERLRVVRNESGDVVRLHWATYAFTRDPRVFGATDPTSAPYDGPDV